MKGKFSKFNKNLLLRNYKGNEAETWHISLYINCTFYSGRIRTLFAMATYIFHRLIMEKVKIDNFFLYQWGYLEFILQKC